jgi:hypothetical protein
VYAYSDNAWTQLGSDIDGEADSDNSGWSVSLNDAGDRVAIGAYYNDGNGTNAGHTRVYAYSDNAWTQLGSDIDGEDGGDEFGWSVSLDADGDRVAIGARYADAPNAGGNAGHVRLYAYSDNAWTQLGSDIDGEAGSDNSGYSVSLNDAGDRVAIGAPYNDDNGTNSGHARVYTYDATAPATVAGLTATSYNGGASLSWTANSESDIAKYYIYSSTDNSTYTKYSTEPTTNSITITDLTKGTSYYYKVSAVDNSNNEGIKSSATGLVYASRGVYVTEDGTGNGLSSGTPTESLSTAVTNSATGDTIYIAAGTYTFSSSSDGNISFDGSKNLVIKGSGSGSTIIDADQKNRHFYFSANSSSTLLDTTFKIMDMT